MNPQVCVVCGGLLGALGVAAGAMGAHALKASLAPQQIADYEVAVRYQIYHALALVLVALVLHASPSRSGQVAAWCFLLGILLFSGCLYAWIFTGIKPLVHLVPVGGVSLIVGWIALALAGWTWQTPSGP